MDRLQYISTGQSAQQQQAQIHQALDHGATWIQLRWKHAPAPLSYYMLAETVKKMCTAYRATLIINDQVDIAKEVDAEGVHLGLQDRPIAEARALLGPAKWIGGTANTFQDVQQRQQEGCDYIGLGPFRFTRTKQNLSPILGEAGYRQIIQQIAQDAAAYPPIYAIGGIQLEDLPVLRAIGLDGVAISGQINQQPELIPSIYKILNQTDEQLTYSQ